MTSNVMVAMKKGVSNWPGTHLLGAYSYKPIRTMCIFDIVEIYFFCLAFGKLCS